MKIFSLKRNVLSLMLLLACLFAGSATALTFTSNTSLEQVEQILVGTDMPTTNTTAELAVGSFQTLVQRFTLTAAVTISTIKLQMSGFGEEQFTLWVTNRIGPGSTQANVLLQTNLTFPNTGGGIRGATVSTPVNLNLAPGKYILVLSSTQVDLHQGWLISTATLPDTAGSAAALHFVLSGNQAFPPASTFKPAEPKPGAFQLLGKLN